MALKSLEKRKAELLKRKQQLVAQIKQIEARDSANKRKENTRLKIIVGALCLNDAKEKHDLKKWLSERIETMLIKPRDRVLIEQFLDTLETHTPNILHNIDEATESIRETKKALETLGKE